ncbi:hypothetical protein [Legionella brunensis]|uniref:Chemoreceptor glutamine deamidase CheD n=1 Tax=Legionella brunensis TaxID=29422 RepID=A0A0W0S0F5_9GAMM|nr:hypothetical protein [Legionella brunensis]KTC76882.1 hypothetical protein Lbru_2989 [Legionella brunensis]
MYSTKVGMQERYEITVEMNKSGFSNDEDEILVTRGISTCIAFVMQGTYSDEENTYTACFGLYHWSGFPFGFQGDPVAYVINELDEFFQQMREELEIEEEIIEVQRLQFIGGEHAQYDDESGVLTLTGTEKEVNALQIAAVRFNYARAGIKLCAQAISHAHFLTSGDQSLEIAVGCDDIDISYQEDEYEYEDESSMNFSETDSLRFSGK